MPIGAARYQQLVGLDGQVASTQSNTLQIGTFSELVNTSGEYLPWGRLVVADAVTEGGVVLPSATGQTVLGVTVFNDRFMRLSSNPDVTGYPVLQSVTLLRAGIMYLRTETALNPGDDVYFRHTENVVPGADEALGRIRNDDDGGNADLLPANSYAVREGALAGEIVAIEFNLPLA